MISLYSLKHQVQKCVIACQKVISGMCDTGLVTGSKDQFGTEEENFRSVSIASAF